jgi:hypothetical protein
MQQEVQSIDKFKTIYISEDSVFETVNDSLPKSRLPKNAIRMPFCRQSNCYHCGVSSLQSIMYYVCNTIPRLRFRSHFQYGFEHREDTLAKKVESGPEHGTNMKVRTVFFFFFFFFFFFLFSFQWSDVNERRE